MLALCGCTLIGCQTGPGTMTPGAADACNASAAQAVIGKHATPELLDQARRDAGAAVARLLRPGDVTTLEYKQHRLTLRADKDLTIQQVGCG